MWASSAFAISSVIYHYIPYDPTTPHHSGLSQYVTGSQTSSCLYLCSLDLVVSHREEEISIRSLWQCPLASVTLMLLRQDDLFLWFLLPVSSPPASMSQDWAPTENIPVSTCVGVSESLTLQYGSFFFMSSCWISLRPWTPFCRPLSYRAWSLGISSCSTATISLKRKNIKNMNKVKHINSYER